MPKWEKLKTKDTLFLIGSIVIILIVGTLLFFKLNKFPNVFLDEGNGFYDSYSLSKYGLDSNLIKNPVYLIGFSGNGQSIMYALVSGFFMHVFGYSIFIYRLPMVLINLTNLIIWLIVSRKKWGIRYSFWIVLVLSTSPYLFTISRYGMDCNFSPFIFSIGLALLIYALDEERKFNKTIKISFAYVIFGITAYSYNVSWLYLPIFVLASSIVIVKSKKVSLAELTFPILVLLVEEIPIILFAIRSNIAKFNETKTILFWTSPSITGRAGDSLVNFNGNILTEIIHNIHAGLNMLLSGSDGLQWNSVGNFGPYYLFTLPLFIIGLYFVCKVDSIELKLILVSLLSNFLILLVVKPNYNHWIFLHIPILLVISVGILNVTKSSKIVMISLIITYLISFSNFLTQYYTNDRYTGWEFRTLSGIRSLDANKHNKVYLEISDPNLIYILRVADPKSPYTFQKTKDHPYSTKYIEAKKTYSNYVRIKGLSNDKKYSKNSVFVLKDDFNNRKYVKKHKLKYVREITFEKVKYSVFVNS